MTGSDWFDHSYGLTDTGKATPLEALRGGAGWRGSCRIQLTSQGNGSGRHSNQRAERYAGSDLSAPARAAASATLAALSAVVLSIGSAVTRSRR